MFYGVPRSVYMPQQRHALLKMSEARCGAGEDAQTPLTSGAWRAPGGDVTASGTTSNLYVTRDNEKTRDAELSERGGLV